MSSTQASNQSSKKLTTTQILSTSAVVIGCILFIVLILFLKDYLLEMFVKLLSMMGINISEGTKNYAFIRNA